MTFEAVAARRGMKSKTMRAIIRAKFNAWAESITDQALQTRVQDNTIVTGGCIASMLLGEPINDFDMYFTDIETADAVAKYYVDKFNAATNNTLSVQTTAGRVKIATENGFRGETAGDVRTLGDPLEDNYNEAEDDALAKDEDTGAAYRPVFLSTNAITLANKVQLILRFYGKPDDIHENYDFVHCTNYWLSKDGSLVLRPEAMEALLARELRYVGSKYPVCSVIRLRKFIKRGWVVNAGQILKMLMQVNELNLLDPAVLEDQLTGVDSAYFMQIIRLLRDKDPEKVNSAYLAEIIERMF